MTKIHLSQEEMEINSALATHDALIELGRQMEKTTTENNYRNNRILELEKMITNFKKDNNVILITMSQKLANSWDMFPKNYYEADKIDKYISIINEYMKLINEEKLSKNKEIETQKNEVLELTKENTESHKEYDEVETKFEENNKYWEERVIKLREKCIHKNKIIKILYCILSAIVSQLLLINYIGFYYYLNMLYVCAYYSGYSIYLILFNINSIIYYVIESSMISFNYIYFQITDITIYIKNEFIINLTMDNINYISSKSLLITTLAPTIIATKYMNIEQYQTICLSGLTPFVYMMIYYKNITQSMAAIVTINGFIFHISQNRIMEYIDITSNTIMIIYSNLYTDNQPYILYYSLFAISIFCSYQYINPNKKNRSIIHVLGVHIPLAYALYIFNYMDH
jgi:hypothetical protein